MITIYYSLEIDRPQSQVFNFLTDPAKVPLWQPSVLKAQGTVGMPAGSIVVLDTQFLGQRSQMRVEMLENDGRSMTHAKSIRGPVQFETTHEVRGLTKMRSQVSTRVRIDAGTIYKLAEPALHAVGQTIIESDMKMLKAILENSESPNS